MAQPIHCDSSGCNELAGILVSNLVTGDTAAYCPEHFNEFVIMYAQGLINAQKAAEEKTREVRPAEPKKKKNKSAALPVAKAPEEPQEATNTDPGEIAPASRENAPHESTEAN
jgi:hypothetical protein